MDKTTKKSNNEKLAEVLRDQKWHQNKDLVKKVGHRFSVSVQNLRSGKYDGQFWDIDSIKLNGAWSTRFKGFNKSYEPSSPTCPNCGHKLHVKDVRKEQ